MKFYILLILLCLKIISAQQQESLAQEYLESVLENNGNQ